MVISSLFSLMWFCIQYNIIYVVVSLLVCLFISLIDCLYSDFQWEQSCYYLTDVRYYHTAVSDTCTYPYSIHPVYIETQEEQTAIASWLSSLSDQGVFLIGLEGASQNVVNWLNGKTLNYTNFDTGSFLHASGQFGMVQPDFKWIDVASISGERVVCETDGQESLNDQSDNVTSSEGGEIRVIVSSSNR